MSKTHSLVAATGLTLLAACSTDSSQPLGPSSQAPRREGSPTFAVEQFRAQTKGSNAGASFTSTDPSGCIETSVFVFGSEGSIKGGPGAPSSTGPGLFVDVFQSDNCSGTGSFLSGGGEATLFEVNRTLTEARLQATITAIDEISGAEVPIEVDLTWTGTGDLLRQMGHEKSQLPGIVVIQSFKNVVRQATASGSVLVGGVNLTPGTLDGFISRDADLQVEHVIS